MTVDPNTFALFLVTIPGSEGKRDAVVRQLRVVGWNGAINIVGFMGRYLPDQVCIKLTRDPNSVNNKGALGCFLSHVDVWERFVHGEASYALVMEDDIFIHDIMSAATIVANSEEFDILFINDRTSENRAPSESQPRASTAISNHLTQICTRRQAVGTDGYIVSRAGAKALLSYVARDGYFSHIDLRVIAYCLSNSDLESVNGYPLGHELQTLRKVCQTSPQLRGRALNHPLVTHNASSSDRVREDRLGRRAKPVSPETSGGNSETATQSRNVLKELRSDVEACLRQYSGQEILYCPTPGNGGDSLISCGAFFAFDRLQIKERTIELDADVTGRVVVIGGGGNLVPMYREARRAIERFSHKAKNIIVLPHTIRNQDELIGSLAENVIFFCRDCDSFDYVKSLKPRFDLRLGHDMCFHIDPEALLESERTKLSVSETWSSFLERNGFTVESLRNKAALNCFRNDAESKQNRFKSDLDLSTVFSFGVNRHYAFAASWCMLKTMSLIQHISTDRLHVGLGSALIGTECTLFDNSYGKNRAVFTHSLQGRFSSVEFADI